MVKKIQELILKVDLLQFENVYWIMCTVKITKLIFIEL